MIDYETSCYMYYKRGWEPDGIQGRLFYGGCVDKAYPRSMASQPTAPLGRAVNMDKAALAILALGIWSLAVAVMAYNAGFKDGQEVDKEP